MVEKIREAAWNLLLECNIHDVLDFDGLEVICRKKRWNLISYKDGQGYVNQFRLQNIICDVPAINHFYDNQYTILYDSSIEDTKAVFVIAKQIGNIVLEQMTKEAIGNVTAYNKDEAFEFACELILPSIVVQGHSITPEILEKLGECDEYIIIHYYNVKPVPKDELPNYKTLLERYNDVIVRYNEICAESDKDGKH